MAGLDNIYSALAKEKESNMQTGLDYSKIREGGVAAAVMAQAGGMLGGAAMQAAGYQTPAQIKQQARNEVKAMFPNPQTRSEMIAMANAFKNLNQMDDYEKIMNLVNTMTTKETAAQRQKSADMDATLAFLESSKGFKLSPEEAAYFKSRIKSDVSVTMGGQVVDTAPNVFDQIIASRGKKSDKGIGDTGLTQAALEKQVGELATKVVKADLSDLDRALTEAEDMFSYYGDKDIPGLSALNVIERQTEEGATNAAAVAGVRNILLKLRSGSAVTESERKSFLEEISGAKVITDKLWKNWVKRIRKLVEQKKKDLFAGERQDVLDAYWEREGTRLKETSNTTQKQQDVLSRYNLK